MAAFYDLCTQRSGGFGSIGYIPISEVLAWCVVNDVRDQRDVSALVRHVKAMDAVYITEVTERQRREAEAKRHDGR